MSKLQWKSDFGPLPDTSVGPRTQQSHTESVAFDSRRRLVFSRILKTLERQDGLKDVFHLGVLREITAIQEFVGTACCFECGMTRPCGNTMVTRRDNHRRRKRVEGKIRNFHDDDRSTIIPGSFVSCSTTQTTGTKYDPRRASMFVVHFGRLTRNRLMRVYAPVWWHGVRGDENRTDDMDGERTTEQWGRERMKDELRRAFYYYFRFALGGSGCDGVPVMRGENGKGGAMAVSTSSSTNAITESVWAF